METNKKIVINLKAPIGSKIPIGLKIPINLQSPNIIGSTSLSTAGVAVIPIFDEKEVLNWNKRFSEELLKFREYLHPTESTIYVYGGFGALGNPSSYHNYLLKKGMPKVLQYFGGDPIAPI